MRFVHIIGIVALSGLSASTSAESDPRPARDTDEIVCKHSARTGTRFKTKTCRTRAHWDRMAEEAKRNYGESQNRPMIEIRKGN